MGLDQKRVLDTRDQVIDYVYNLISSEDIYMVSGINSLIATNQFLRNNPQELRSVFQVLFSHNYFIPFTVYLTLKLGEDTYMPHTQGFFKAKSLSDTISDIKLTEDFIELIIQAFTKGETIAIVMKQDGSGEHLERMPVTES